MKKIASLFMYCLTIFSGLHAQPPQNIADGLQQILQDALPTNFTNPGAVMGVVVPGHWSWYGAAGNGISGMTAGHPATTAQPNTRFRVGSVTKAMVATCILKLEQDGLLSIEDPIDTYLRSTLINDTIQPSQTVTIHYLLNHTSGIANAADNNSCQLNILSNMTASHTLEESIYCGGSLGELFTPGTSWSYSNTNYSILAMIIENVSGMSYSAYLNQTIFQPLNMTNTEIPVTDEITGDHMGCYWNIQGLGWTDLTIIDATTYTGWADVVSNTTDLIIFHQALLGGTIINPTQLNKMKTIDAAANNYGLGMEFNTVDFVSYYGHYGEVGNTNGLFFCELNSTIAPNGYYFTYNFNTQGVPMITAVDRPVYHLIKGDLGIEENLGDLFDVSPNPSDIKFSISTKNDLIRGYSLIDNAGRVLLTQKMNEPVNQIEVNVNSVVPGIYNLTIHGSNGMVMRKIQVQ